MRKARELPVVILTAYVMLTAGSAAGLCWLAPLEYRTGCWLGIPEGLAAVVPTLIDSYVVLSVLTARDRRWALPVAALSGGVGQLHAAGVLPETSVLVRGWVAALAVLLAVCVTARLKPLVGVVVRTHREGLAAERAATEAAHLARTESAREAARVDAQAAHERDLEAARVAHEQRLAEAAHAAALTRTEPAHDGAIQTAPVRRTTKRTTGARKVAQPSAQPGDLQRRRDAERVYKDSVRSGRALEPAALAKVLCGVETPDGAQLARARARASEWRRAVAAEGSESAAQAAGGEH